MCEGNVASGGMESGRKKMKEIRSEKKWRKGV